MPLPRLKLTPAEIAEQERKARKKRLRKIKRYVEDLKEFEEGSSTRTLFCEGVGHVEGLTDDAIQNESKVFEQKRNERRELEMEDTGGVDDTTTEGDGVARIPRRWRSDSSTPQSQNDLDIGIMDDLTYSEWIRKGHYKLGDTVRVGDINFIITDQSDIQARKRKVGEYERLQQEKEERRRRERRERKEQKRKEEEEERERGRQRVEHEQRRKREAVQNYNERWKVLLSSSHPDRPALGSLYFSDIPWPTFTTPTSPDDLQSKLIKDFVLTPTTADLDDEGLPSLKDMLRPYFLRFHPDKFNGKVMPLVVQVGDEGKAVAEGVGIVMRCLNTLVETKGS